MIRFACPSCSAAFSVADDKAGKTGKCPKCQSQFIIPYPENTAPNTFAAPSDEATQPSEPSEPPRNRERREESRPSTEPIEVSPCPKCNGRMSVTAADLNTNVECPYCATVFVAERIALNPEPRPSKRTSQHASRDWGDDERPSRLKRNRDDDDYDDDEDDFRPRRRSRRSNGVPSNVSAIGGMLLGGAIYGLIYTFIVTLSSFGVCCLWPGVYLTLVWSILAIIRASAILGKNDMQGPPRTLLILQILCILNLDIINCVLGIIGLVMLNDPATQDYFDRYVDRD